MMRVAAVCAAASVAFAIGVQAHGLVGVVDPPGSELCVCTNTTDAEAVADPCSTGRYYSAARGPEAPAPEAKLLVIVKLERLVARLRQELASGNP